MEKQEENTLQSIDSTLKRIEKRLIRMEEHRAISFELPLQACDGEVNEGLDCYSKNLQALHDTREEYRQ